MSSIHWEQVGQRAVGVSMKLKAALIALIAFFGVVYLIQTAKVQMWIPPSYHWPAGGYT